MPAATLALCFGRSHALAGVGLAGKAAAGLVRPVFPGDATADVCRNIHQGPSDPERKFWDYGRDVESLAP